MAGESPELRSERAAIRRAERVRAARHASRGRPDGWGARSRDRAGRRRGEAPAAPRLRCRDRIDGAARRRLVRGTGQGRSGVRRGRSATCRRRSAATIADPRPDRGPRPRRGRRAASRGSPRSRRSACRSWLDDPRPRRGTAQSFWPSRAPMAGSWPPTAPRRRRRAPPPARPARDLPLVGHEVKPILVAAVRRRIPGRPPTPVEFDTQVAAYILNAALRSQTIADVVAERLDLDPAAAEGARRRGPGRASRRSRRSPSATPLAAALEEDGLERLFREIELPLIPVLARMEADGVALDLEALAVLGREFATEIARLEAEIYAAVGHEFKIGSPKQLEQILFYELKLPKGKRTKTGYSTDASVLEELRPAHPMIEQAARVADLHEAPLDLRRGAAGADRRRRPPPHDVPPGRRRDRAPVVVRPEPAEHPDPHRARPQDPPRVRRRANRTSCCSRPTTRQIELRILAHVSGDEHLKRRVRAPGGHPPRDGRAGARTRRPRRSPRTSARWPRWSTSGWPTG